MGSMLTRGDEGEQNELKDDDTLQIDTDYIEHKCKDKGKKFYNALGTRIRDILRSKDGIHIRKENKRIYLFYHGKLDGKIDVKFGKANLKV